MINPSLVTSGNRMAIASETPHAGRCNQPEHGGVSERSDRIVGAKSLSGVDQPSNLLWTIDIGRAPFATGPAEKISGGNFMTRIFGMQREREATDRQQAVATLFG